MLNSSDISTLSEKNKLKSISSYTSNVYSRKIGQTNIRVVLDYTLTDKVDKDKDFYIDFVNQVDRIKPYGGNMVTGKVDNIGNELVNRIQILANMNLSNTGETGAHEIGHTAGLRHEIDEQNPEFILQSMGKNNIMNALNFGNTLSTLQQIKEIDKNIPAMNIKVVLPKLKLDTSTPIKQDNTRAATIPIVQK